MAATIGDNIQNFGLRPSQPAFTNLVRFVAIGDPFGLAEGNSSGLDGFACWLLVLVGILALLCILSLSWLWVLVEFGCSTGFGQMLLGLKFMSDLCGKAGMTGFYAKCKCWVLCLSWLRIRFFFVNYACDNKQGTTQGKQPAITVGQKKKKQRIRFSGNTRKSTPMVGLKAVHWAIIYRHWELWVFFCFIGACLFGCLSQAWLLG